MFGEIFVQVDTNIHPVFFSVVHITRLDRLPRDFDIPFIFTKLFYIGRSIPFGDPIKDLFFLFTGKFVS